MTVFCQRCGMVLGLLVAFDVGVLGDEDQGMEPTPYGNNEWQKHFRTPLPEEWNPSPCEIFRDITDEGNRIVCENISSPEELVSIFARLKNPSGLYMSFFVLANSTLKLVPDGVFGNATFANVVLFNNSLEVVERNVLKGMEKTLRHVHLEGNRIKTIGFLEEAKNLQSLVIVDETCEIADYTFAKLAALQVINIADCPLCNIGNYVFADLRNVQFIFIEDCSIVSIGNYAFANLPRLSMLTIRSSSIISIGNYAFANTPGIIEIENGQSAGPVTKIGDYAFSSNEIREITFWNVKITDDSLSSNTFVGVRGFINFQSTSLTTLKEDVFSPLVEGNRVIITGELMCDDSMDWIITRANPKGRLDCSCKDGKELAEHTCSRIPKTCKGNSSIAA